MYAGSVSIFMQATVIKKLLRSNHSIWASGKLIEIIFRCYTNSTLRMVCSSLASTLEEEDAKTQAHDAQLTLEDILVDRQKIHWGKKRKNPLNQVGFFKKVCDIFRDPSISTRIVIIFRITKMWPNSTWLKGTPRDCIHVSLLSSHLKGNSRLSAGAKDSRR